MRGLLGLLIVAAIAVGFYYFYFEKTKTEGGTAGAIEAISTTGVKNDLNAIANAERMFFSTNGRYATWDEMVSSGELRLAKPERDGYVYTVEASASGFTVTARYRGPGNYPTLEIDQTMQIRESR
jgi:hypothetical protein